MKRLYILWMGILLILAATHTHAQVVFNATNFPDANFRQYLKDNFSSYGFTTEGVTVSAANLQSIQSINCLYKSIANLKGIEFFTKLTNLNCSGNKLTALDVTRNTALTYLSCSNNDLTALDVTRNTALTYLSCSNNDLTALDVTRNTNLETLYASGTFSTVNLNYNTKLKYLFLSNTKALTELDLTKNTALISLRLWDGILTSLNLSKNTNLKYLNLDGTRNITSLDLTKCTKLQAISMSYSYLTSVQLGANSLIEYINFTNSGASLTTFDVTQCPNLWWLDVSVDMPTLDVSKNTKLKRLILSGKYTSIDLSKNTNLNVLGLYSSMLTSLDLSKLTKLVAIYIGNAKLRALDLSKQANIGNIGITDFVTYKGGDLVSCHYGGFSDIPSSGLNSSVYYKYIGKQSPNEDLLIQSNTKVGLSYPSTVNASYVSNMQIGGTAVTPANQAIGGANYHTFTRTFAQVNDILWSSSPSITYSYDTKCPSTDLTDAEKKMSVTVTTTPYVAVGDANGGSGNFPDTNFRTVAKTFDTKIDTRNYNTGTVTTTNGADNKLSKVELQAITNLQVASKGIANIGGLEYMKYLQTLNCSGNSLTALNANNHPSLTTVYCQNNQLAGLTFDQSKTSLKYLNCSGNKFTGLNFTDFNALQYLNVSAQTSTSKLTGLTLPSSTELKELYCQNNALTRMPGTTGLQIINCSYNQLIQGLNFTGFNALRELYCNNNNLTTTVTLPDSPNLQRFHCHNNQLTGELDASKNTGLVSLQCYNNPNLGTLKLPTTKTLTQLWCYNNGLSGTLDISYYTNLQDFGCQTNKISTLKLPATATLWRLHANDNELAALDVTANTGLTTLRCHNNRLRTLDLSKNAALTELNCANQTSTEDVSVFDYNKIGVYLPTGGKKDNFVDMQVAGVAQAADVLTNSGKQYLVVNSAQMGDVDLYDKTVTYGYKTECASPNFPNATMTGVTITTYPYVMWVNPNSKSVSGNYYSGTIVLDYDAVVPAGTEVYAITGLKATPRDMMYDGTKYSMQQFNMQRIAVAGQVVPKNTPVYVKSDTQDGLFAFGRNTANATPVAVPSGNLLKGSATAAVSVDSYGALTLGREKKTGEVGFWQNKATSIPAHRCYLEASILEGANGAKGAVFCFDDEDDDNSETTNVNAIDNSPSTNDNWHSLDGRKLNGKPATKGIYIHNGRKEVVR